MKDSKYSKTLSSFLSGLVLTFATLTPGIGEATTYYVAKAGNDSNPGTEISPFLTIKRGVKILSAGDTLYVKAGTYAESILSWQTTIRNGASWNNPVTVAANPGDTVTIKPPSGTAFFWVKDGQAKYLIIDGFIIDGNDQAKHGFKFDDNSRYIRVQNCEIKNAANSGILVTECSGCLDPGSVPKDTYHEFLNLNIHNNGSSRLDHGFYIATGYNLVENSTVHHNKGYGGHVFRSTINLANYNTIRNSSFFENNTTGEWGCGLLLSSGEGNIAYNNIAYGNFNGFCIGFRATNALLYNNLSYGNNARGIYVGFSPVSGSRIENNTVYNNGIHGIFVGDGSADAVIRNNIAYKNTSADIYLAPGDQNGTTVSHNLTTDPLFLNPAANDFRVDPNSSAIDAGLTIPEVSVDFFGVKRAQGKAYDIGAIELETLEDTSAPATPKNFRIAN